MNVFRLLILVLTTYCLPMYIAAMHEETKSPKSVSEPREVTVSESAHLLAVELLRQHPHEL